MSLFTEKEEEKVESIKEKIPPIIEIHEHENILLYDKNPNETIFGINKFIPDIEYPVKKTVGFGDTTTLEFKAYTNKRETVFIFFPKINKVYLLANNDNYSNQYDFDSIDTHANENILSKIQYVYEKKQTFNIFPDSNEPFIVSLDMPFTQQRNKYVWHQDSMVRIFLNPYFYKLFKNPSIFPPKNNCFLSNYTFIEYRDVCITTTIKNPLNPEDIIRFMACPGTVVCIENIKQEHTAPFWGNINKENGDEIVMNDFSKEKIRNLYRTQFLSLPEQLSDNKIFNIRDLISKNLIKEINMPKIQFIQSLHPISFIEYLSSNRHSEFGGKKSKSKKSKSKKSKSKKSKSKKSKSNFK